MKVKPENTREIVYSEYRNLLTLYIQQMTKADELQRENTALHNLVLELRETVDKLKKRPKK